MKNYEGFQQKIALVTGGAGGIGKGISTNLAAQGATIVIADINLAAAEAAVKELAAEGAEAFAVQMDVSSEASVEAGFKAAIEKYGTIDILVNNAASPGSGVAIPHIFSKPLSDWEHVFNIDLMGIVYCVKQVYSLFRERKSGKIINIASIAGRMPSPSVPEYAAIKAGVIQYTQTLAKDLAPYNVNVNAICPGFLFTDLWKKMGATLVAHYPEDKRPTPYQAFQQMIKGVTPLGREQQVEDIAYLATFLCSDYAQNITGQAINVDGGTCMN